MQLDRLKRWIDPSKLRKSRVSSRTRSFDGRGGGEQETWCMHWRMVPLAVAELDPRQMPAEMVASLAQFKRECAEALAAYFTDGGIVVRAYGWERVEESLRTLTVE